ncbi:MAG: hypothetical protein PVJ38_07105 [Candidatus Bathyarchaeota archaeon]
MEVVLEAIKEGGRWTHYAGDEISDRFREAVVQHSKAFSPSL